MSFKAFDALKKKLEVLPFALQGPGGIPITFYSHILSFYRLFFFGLKMSLKIFFFKRFVHQVQVLVKNCKEKKPRKKSWKNIRCFMKNSPAFVDDFFITS